MRDVPLALAIPLEALESLEALEALAIPLEALTDGAVFEGPHPLGPEVTVRVA